MVAGPSRAGGSTVLLSVIESLLRGGSEVVLAAPRDPRRCATSPAATASGRSSRGRADLSTEEHQPLMEAGEGPVVLVVDDGELLRDVGAKDYLKGLVRTGGDRRRAIVPGGDSAEVGSGFSGWQVDVKGRQGVLISPQGITDGELVGVRVPRSSLGDGGRTLQAPVTAAPPTSDAS